MQVIPKNTISFLKELKLNNNRDWFNKNKDQFKSIQADIKTFAQEVKDSLNLTDDIEKLKIFRIYRDLRFSKDKTPFKKNIGMAFHRAKPELRGGYYLEISADESFVAVGFWNPNKEDLLRIRKEIEIDGQEFKSIINQKKIKDIWGEIKGEEVKTSPKGFDREHPANDLLQYKQYIFSKKVDHKTIFSQEFETFIIDHFKTLLPVLNYMGEVLNTNLDGESLL